jgi:hypothetical protein
MTELRASEIKNEDGDFYDWCQKLRNGQIDEDTLLNWTLSSEPLATLLKLYEQTAETCGDCKGDRVILNYGSMSNADGEMPK